MAIRKKGIMYTYVLYDSKEDLYKIGRTKSPLVRLRQLCKRGEISAITVIPKDIEKKLHKQFTDFRQLHPTATDGKTEWFKKGGKLSTFIDSIPKKDAYPFLSPEVLFEDMLTRGSLILSKSIMWDISSARYGKYLVGVDILVLVGALKLKRFGLWTKAERHNISIDNRKIGISEFIIDYLCSKYEFKLYRNFSSVTTTNVKKITIDGGGIIPDSFAYLQFERKKQE